MEQPSPTFMNIPYEIRLQILKYLLHSPTPLSRVTRVASLDMHSNSNLSSPNNTVYWRFELGGNLKLQPCILAVCRQLYDEGHSILYGNTVLISIAIYQTFQPVDILGNWKIDNMLQPTRPGSRLPDLRRFQNLEFHLYVDFSSSVPDSKNEFFRLCRKLVNAGSGQLNCVTIWAVDGSHNKMWTKFSDDAWQPYIESMLTLDCKEFIVKGDIAWQFEAYAKMTVSPKKWRCFI